jgi:nitrate reductase cytochrome c-type subunit
MRHLILLPVLASVIISCAGEEEQLSENTKEEVQDTIIVEDEHNGFQLLQTSCFSCHSHDASYSATAAPNMAEVKRAYLSEYPVEDDFVAMMVDFLSDPSEEKAIMNSSVEQFGVMPNMGLTEGQNEAVARYLYQSTIEDSSWYSLKYPLEKAKYLVDPKDMSYVDRGFQFAMSTKSVLGKNLKGKIKSEGTDGALTFCNVKALHLTDSMAAEFGVSIKRVSDKNRNPNNAANAYELEIIESFKRYLEDGKEIVPTTVEGDELVTGYYPILTNQMCMQCHGSQDEIKSSTAQLIKEKYPMDKATGYGINELRGIWVVEMQK